MRRIMQTRNIFERLLDTHPEVEIWWDSSPLIYDRFTRKMVDAAPEDEKENRRAQFDRLYNEKAPEKSLFRGVTTNPPLSLQAIEEDPSRWERFVDGLIEKDPSLDVDGLFWSTYREMVRAGAEKYLKVFEASKGMYGYISGQVDPRACFDAPRMLEMALDLASLSPNVMIKVPGTKEGYQVIEELAARGIGTNNTLSFTVSQILAAAEAARRGIETARAKGVSLDRWRAVITFMCSRFTQMGDMQAESKEKGIEIGESDLRWAELALFKKMHRLLKERGYESKMLICSMKMGPNTEEIRQLWHLQKLSGADVVFTCPPPFIEQTLNEYDDIDLPQQGFHEEVPQPVLDKLLRLTAFREGYEEDGLSSDDFNEYLPLKKTAKQHIEVTEKMVDFVRGRLST